VKNLSNTIKIDFILRAWHI